MNAEIHQLRPRPTVNWMCSACGVDAGCNCGAPLMSKSQQAAEKLMANPNRSDRSIAAEIGMSQPGVSKVRHKLETDSQLSVDDEPRVGLDGKARRMPTKRDEDAFDHNIAVEQTKQVFLLGTHEAIRVAEYYGPVDQEIIDTAKDAAAAWCRLVSKLTGEAL